jgi:molecular chaperone GrpE
MIDKVLADFRSWLAQMPISAAPSASTNNEKDPGDSVSAPIDLQTLLSQFIALRHEVNLQTKAVRSQQELNAETLQGLTNSLEALEKAYEESLETESEKANEGLRPLLKALVDVRDALALARREVQRVQEAMVSALDRLITKPEPVPVEVAGTKTFRSWLKKWSGRDQEKPLPLPPHQPDGAEEAARHVRLLLESVVIGYMMSLQRIERVLQQQGLEPMECAGEPFDPERMEVVEAVTDSGRFSGEVLEEIRPGYLWNGRVFRFAQVRVAKSQ